MALRSGKTIGESKGQTPAELAQKLNAIKTMLKEELEYMRDFDKITEDSIFSEKLMLAVKSAVYPTSVEYIDYKFDKYPYEQTYVEVETERGDLILWRKVEAVDKITAIISGKKIEILINYEAEILQVGSRNYIKITDLKGIDIRVIE
jgi:hypothetical protein